MAQAFWVKYKTEFRDNGGCLWEVDILEQGWPGGVTELDATGDPLTFAFDNETDCVFSVIRESHATVRVYSNTDFALQDLYSQQDLHFKVNIYQDAVLYWTGWIDSGGWTEPYEEAPYPVEIACTDGLDMLAHIQYLSSDRVYFTGRVSIITIIISVLDQISTATVNEYINIYESRMESTSTADDSALDRIFVDTDVLRDMYCDEVLTNLLSIFNACIRQVDGEFCIYRPVELKNPVVYGRHFINDSSHTSISLAPLLYINRP